MSREQQIKEARTIEAMKNGYMGLEGKFCSITKYIGQPIFHQGSRVFEQTFLDDPYHIPEADDIPMMEEDQNSYEVGQQFDGLTRGMNLTISVAYHLREITCRHEGRIVYKEIAGELEAYAPDPAWEDKIETLATLSRTLERQERPIERRKLIESNQKKRTEILDYLKLKWGL
jgi:hypothetical protein